MLIKTLLEIKRFFPYKRKNVNRSNTVVSSVRKRSKPYSVSVVLHDRVQMHTPLGNWIGATYGIAKQSPLKSCSVKMPSLHVFTLRVKMAISAFLLSPSQERSRKGWCVQQPCLRHLRSIFLVCFMCGVHTSCLLGNILSSCCRRNMEYVLLSPLHFFHAVSYCCDRCGLGWTWNVSYEQRLEALRKVRGRTANRWALEMEMLPSSSTVPRGGRLGCPCLSPRHALPRSH